MEIAVLLEGVWVPRLPHWPAPAARSSGSLTGARESSGGTQ